jgi:hypothetical protein
MVRRYSTLLRHSQSSAQVCCPTGDTDVRSQSRTGAAIKNASARVPAVAIARMRARSDVTMELDIRRLLAQVDEAPPRLISPAGLIAPFDPISIRFVEPVVWDGVRAEIVQCDREGLERQLGRVDRALDTRAAGRSDISPDAIVLHADHRHPSGACRLVAARKVCV